MALCTQPVYNNLTCYQYPADGRFTCQRFLGGKYVYASNQDLYKATLRSFDEGIRGILVYLELPLQSDICLNYLTLLICHYLYPLCIPNGSSNVWSKKQKICDSACNFFRDDLCAGKTDRLASLITIDYIDINQQFKDSIISILKEKCTNNDVFDNNYISKEKDCFFEKVYEAENISDTCDSNGYIYKGNISRTSRNKTCVTWTNVCLKHIYINFERISASDRNYCRNPGGYRERPWCYVNEVTKEWEFCDVPKCPAIDGNYSPWSEWSSCTEECMKTRSRNCTNPRPKYGGKNCTLLGPSLESIECGPEECTLPNSDGENGKKTTSSTVIVLSVVVPSFAVTIIPVLAFVLYRKKKRADQIMCGDIDELTTTENIVKFIMYDSETDQLSPEEEMYIQMIYDHLKTFRKECLCLNCIRAWLLSMIQDNEDADKVQHHITNMLEDLAKYSYITNNDNDVDDGHSKTCFFEHQIKDWFSETITIDQSTYSKLQRNKENDKLGTLELPEGLFLLNGVKIYHRLNRGNKKVAYHTLSSGSTTENMEDDIEVPSETNQQQKENVNFGYENSSKEVRPNSSTDLNLSGMSNSHSSEWDSLMQYKSTY